MVYPLFLVLLYLFVVILGSPDAPFPQGDEIMHIRSIRESLETGNYLIPSLSGLPNPYKPPLLFWLGMASDRIFGIGYFQERFVSLFFGLGSLLLLFGITLQIQKERKEVFLTTLFFGFSFLSLKFFSLLMMEGPMVFFLLFYFYLFFHHKRTKDRKLLLWGSVLVGVGYLLKGPILQVYLFLFVFSHLYIRMVRIRKGKISILWNRIPEEKYLLYSLALTLLLPIGWILYLYISVPSGKELIRFFFITENIGKFYAANQPGLRIWFGWILYSIPFTIPFLQLFWNQLRNPRRSKYQSYVMTILVFLLLVTTLHLLPNRKDPYYVTPFISLLFLLPSFKKFTWESLLTTKTNQFALIIAYFFLVMVSIVVRLPNLFLVSLLGLLLLGSSVCFFETKKNQWLAVLFTQIAIIPIVIFFLLRPMADPDLRSLTKEAENASICVIAENPWTAMDVQNKLMEASVQFALPLTIQENCSKSEYLINFTDAKITNEFTKLKSWFQWKQHLQMEAKSVFSSILKMEKQKFQTEISLWKREATP